jgi:hypothetical protein
VTTQQQNWFTHGEAATYCRIHPRTLRRWRAAGRIRAYGGRYFRNDLDRAVRNEPAQVPSEKTDRRDPVIAKTLDRIVTDVVDPPEGTLLAGSPRTGNGRIAAPIAVAVGGLISKEAVRTAQFAEETQVRLRARGMSAEDAEQTVREAQVLQRVSLLTFAEALTYVLGKRNYGSDEIAQMDTHADGAAERNGDPLPPPAE